MDKFGLAEPIVINLETNVIIGGHARWLTLKSQNIRKCDCYVPNRKLTDKEIEELNIRLNKNIAGKWDFDILANEFESLELLDWGFNERELGLLAERINEQDEWEGMPEFSAVDAPPRLIISFRDEKDRDKFDKKYSLKSEKKTDKVWATWWPFRPKEDLTAIKYET